MRTNKIVLTIKDMISGTIFDGNTFLVGGSVRDMIMGKPVKDYDFCVSLPDGGVKLAQYLCETYPTKCKNYVIFQTFGTAKFTLILDSGDEYDIELVQTRKEQYHDKNSRNPECSFGTIEEDCFRRDLTINALYLDLHSMDILDLTKMGIKDIQDNVIRTPTDPDITFTDDPLRSLRCIRFSCRYGWDIEPKTYDSLVINAKSLSIISKERIFDEFSKILTSDNFTFGLEMLIDTGLMEYIIPEVSMMRGVTQNEYHIGDVYEHTILAMKQTKPELMVRLATLLHDVGKIKTKTIGTDGRVHFYKHEIVGAEMADKILKNLKVSNSTSNSICFAIKEHMRTKCFKEDAIKDAKLRKLQAELGHDFDLVLDVIDADNKAHIKEFCIPTQVDNIRRRLRELELIGMDCKKVSLPVDGFDIMSELSIGGGPKVKEILKTLTKMYYNDPKITREQCLKIIKNIW